MGALIPLTGKNTGFVALYIHDNNNAAQHRKQFYGILREYLLSRLAAMLHEKSSPLHIFISLSDLMNANCITEDVPLVIHAHEETKLDHEKSTTYRNRQK